MGPEFRCAPPVGSGVPFGPAGPRHATSARRACPPAARRSAPFLPADRLQQLLDPRGMLHALVELEVQFRHGAGSERARGATAEEAGGALKSLERARLLRLVAGDVHADPGVGQIVGDEDAGDGDEADPGIPDLAGERLGDHLADGAGHLLRATGRLPHRYTVAVSTIRTPSVSSTVRSAARRISSTTGRADPTTAHAISARCQRSW